MNWLNSRNWRQASYNTLWCLIGCSIGDFGAIMWFQKYKPQLTELNPLLVWGTAIVCGIMTSILLETVILIRKKFSLSEALKTALGMSLISMVAMEVAMNLTDYFIMGKPQMNLITLFPMLTAGFLTPLPYNYWRLEHLGKSCCGS